MNKDEFKQWYMEHIDLMVEMGVLHPDSPFGKTVRLAVSSLHPEIERLNARIDELEYAINNNEKVKPQPKPEKKPKPKVEVKKAVEVKQTKVVEEKPKSLWHVQKKGL